MKPVRAHAARVVAVLIVLTGIGLARYFDARSPAVDAVADAAGKAPTRPDPTSPAGNIDPGGGGLDLGSVPTDSHRAQIARVVEAMDQTGKPPTGVVQGGRRGGVKGVFQNAEGRLPRRPAGYWVESDVWPRDGPRDAERLIFGRGDEVFWTRDHYRTFVRLR